MRAAVLAAAMLSLASEALAQECAPACGPSDPTRCAGTAACLCRASPRWPAATPVEWWLFNAPIQDVPFDQLLTEVTAAFDTWGAVACSRLRFAYRGTVFASPPSSVLDDQDGRSMLLWIPSGWAWGSATLGVTHVARDTQTNAIVDADIEFNEESQVWSTTGAGQTVDVRTVVLHEVAHLWGAVHTPNDVTAILYPSYAGGQNHVPGADDVGQLCCLYPTTAATGTRGDFCQVSSNCLGGLVCARPASGGDAICADSCTPGPGSCPDGFACGSAVTDSAGVSNACFVAVSVPSDLCAFCDTGAQCSTGLCVGLGDTSVCSTTCRTSTQCGDGYGCGSMPNGSRVCIPSFSPPADPVCPTPQCDAGRRCPDGYHCEASGMCRGGGPDESCALALTCDSASTLCVDDGSGPRCRRQCGGSGDCPQPAQDCFPTTTPNVSVCLPVAVTDGGTPAPDGGAGPCEPCTLPRDCQDGTLCLSTPATSTAFCYAVCPAGGTCGGGMVCAWSAGTSEYCSCPFEVAARGDPCGASVSRLCGASDLCVGSASEGYRCRETCVSGTTCPFGFGCTPVSGGGSACLPGRDDGGVPPSDAGDADGAGWADGGEGDGGSGSDGGATADGAGSGAAAGAPAPAGCGCGATGPAGPAGWAAALLVALASSRGRRRPFC